MFVGHFGVALAAKRAAPGTSLGTLVAASIWLDLVWPVLLLVGVERNGGLFRQEGASAGLDLVQRTHGQRHWLRDAPELFGHAGRL